MPGALFSVRLTRKLSVFFERKFNYSRHFCHVGVGSMSISELTAHFRCCRIQRQPEFHAFGLQLKQISVSFWCCHLRQESVKSRITLSDFP
ncbi:hypothetical protein CEXT_781411 [Caerostris extrusa]|uniref:Uncharacterized protein n=1 Tax=Caerostris extrusa TaxID=172846 RepID=A0AAV4SK41_CAEEX|nr:hypothetical protein CEXT_781411 [Caerostris extrusa]